MVWVCHRLAPEKSGGGLGVPRGFVATQAIDPGMGQHRAFDRGFDPGDGSGLGSRLIQGQDDIVTGAQARPIGVRQVEMAAEVEPGDLADLIARALGGDETEGEIWFATGPVPGCRFADEHAVERGHRGARGATAEPTTSWHADARHDGYGWAGLSLRSFSADGVASRRRCAAAPGGKAGPNCHVDARTPAAKQSRSGPLRRVAPRTRFQVE